MPKKPRRYTSDWNRPHGEVPTLHRSFHCQRMYDISKAVQFCKTQPKPVTLEVKMDLPPFCVGYAVQHLLKVVPPEWEPPSEVLPYHNSYFAQAAAADASRTQIFDYAGLESRIIGQMMMPRGSIPATDQTRGLRAGELAAIFGASGRASSKVMSFAILYGMGNRPDRSITYSTLESGLVRKISKAMAEQIVKPEPEPEVVSFVPVPRFSYRPFSNESFTRPVLGSTWHERLLQDAV